MSLQRKRMQMQGVTRLGGYLLCHKVVRSSTDSSKGKPGLWIAGQRCGRGAARPSHAPMREVKGGNVSCPAYLSRKALDFSFHLLQDAQHGRGTTKHSRSIR